MKQIRISRTQAGFTLIELVVVIVILGILAATALPKFINVQTDARVASIKAARGSVVSAMNLAHAEFLVRGTATGGTASIEGVTATNVLGLGYPLASEVTAAGGLAGLSTDYTSTTAAGVTTVSLAGAPTPATCSFTYTDSVGTVPAVVSQVNTAGC